MIRPSLFWFHDVLDDVPELKAPMFRKDRAGSLCTHKRIAKE
jgi:hypothetical protein